jgi:hypothetical protein
MSVARTIVQVGVFSGLEDIGRNNAPNVFSHLLIGKEIPRLCRGGSRCLTTPGVCSTHAFSPFAYMYRRAEAWGLTLIGCGQAPLRGQQP